MSRSACPYVGLQPFTEAESGLFFGRERDVKLIVTNLRVAPLTVMYGDSGVGKSSVLRAGVVPKLRALPNTAIAYVHDWQSTRSLEALKQTCVMALSRAPGAVALPADAAVEMPLDVLLLELTDRCRYDLFLILDQFEDWLTFQSPFDVADVFDQEFARVVNRADPCISTLIALRSDALFRLDRYRTRIPRLLENTLRLRHLDTAAAEQAIRQPLAIYSARCSSSIDVDDTLVDAVISDIRAVDYGIDSGARGTGGTAISASVEAPLLQMVMTRLWEEDVGVGSSILRMDTYLRLGRAVRIARTHLDRIMGALSQADQDLCATLFDRLVTPSGAAIAQTPSDLAASCSVPEAPVVSILTRLTGARILRALPPPLEAPDMSRFAVFHDVLARSIVDWRRRYLLERAKEQARHDEQERIEMERRERRKIRVARLSRLGVAVLAALVILGGFAGLRREVHVRARWAELSGPPGGAIRLLVLDPNAPGTLYVALYGRDGGVFRSDDGGDTWTRVPVGLGQDVATALAIDPREPRRMFLGTAGAGVLRSTDGGDTWSPINDGLYNLNVVDLALSPTTADEVLVVTSGGGGGLYTSRDAGSHWRRTNDVSSVYPHRVLLDTDPRDARTVVVLSAHGVFRSRDSGSAFALLDEPDVPTDVVHEWATGSDGTAYVVARAGTLYRKSPADDEWVPLGLSDPDDVVLHVWVDRRADDRLYVSVRSALGSHLLLASRRRGAIGSWEDVGDDLTRAPVQGLMIAPGDSRRLYLGTDCGLFRGNADSLGWTAISGALGKANVRSIAVDPSDADRIWAGGYGGVFLSEDGGRTWTLTNSGLLAADVRTVAIDPSDPHDVFAGVYRPGRPGSIFRLARSAGRPVWAETADGIPDDDTRALLFRTSSASGIYAGTFSSGVWHSRDGKHWEPRNRGLDRLDVIGLVGDAQSPETLYAATGGGVYRSDDSGATWRSFNDGLTDPHVQTIAADGTRPGVVYAGTRTGVFVSQEHGAWRPINAGLDRLNAVVLRADPLRSGVAYLATDTGGVYRTPDGGRHWTSIAQTATSSAVLALEIPLASRSTLLAGTADAGVLEWTRRYVWQVEAP